MVILRIGGSPNLLPSKEGLVIWSVSSFNVADGHIQSLGEIDMTQKNEI